MSLWTSPVTMRAMIHAFCTAAAGHVVLCKGRRGFNLGKNKGKIVFELAFYVLHCGRRVSFICIQFWRSAACRGYFERLPHGYRF